MMMMMMMMMNFQNMEGGGSAIDQDLGPPISGDSSNNYKTIKEVRLFFSSVFFPPQNGESVFFSCRIVFSVLCITYLPFPWFCEKRRARSGDL
jgi:hypothetical protein